MDPTGVSWAPHNTPLHTSSQEYAHQRENPQGWKAKFTPSGTSYPVCCSCEIVKASVPGVVRTASSQTELADPRVGKG